MSGEGKTNTVQAIREETTHNNHAITVVLIVTGFLAAAQLAVAALSIMKWVKNKGRIVPFDNAVTQVTTFEAIPGMVQNADGSIMIDGDAVVQGGMKSTNLTSSGGTLKTVSGVSEFGCSNLLLEYLHVGPPLASTWSVPRVGLTVNGDVVASKPSDAKGDAEGTIYINQGAVVGGDVAFNMTRSISFDNQFGSLKPGTLTSSYASSVTGSKNVQSTVGQGNGDNLAAGPFTKMNVAGYSTCVPVR